MMRVLVKSSVSGLFVERGAILAQPPGPQIRRVAGAHRDDDVAEVRPSMIEVVLRRFGRMVGMRVIEADQVGADAPRVRFALSVIGGADEEPPSRALRGDV